jgi:uncharacterized protein (TIGR00369 family)
MSNSKTEPHFKALIKMYKEAPINSLYQPKLSIEEGRAVVSIHVTERFHHSAGGLHGSIYFKMLDDAAFFAANSVDFTHFVLTADFRVDLIRPFSVGEIISTGEIVHTGRTAILAKAELHCSNGKLLATGSGRFSRSSILLNEESGYFLSE